MKQYRLNRLFNARSNRCFDVAVDHGFFNERGFLQGIENLERSVKILAAAAPDAIQLTVGQAHYLQSLSGKEKPALVLRTDVANVYGSVLPRLIQPDDRQSRRAKLTSPRCFVCRGEFVSHSGTTRSRST